MEAIRDPAESLVIRVPDPDRLSDRELLDACRDLRRVARQVDAVLTRVVGEIDRRGAFSEEHATSTTGWLVAEGEPASKARSTVGVARDLEVMPATAEAFSSGDLVGYRVRLVCEARKVNADQFGTDEAVLVDTITGLTAADARKAVAYWCQAAAPEAAVEAEEAAYEARRLYVSPSWGRTVAIDGQLDGVGGETVITALQSHLEPSLLDDEDRRSVPQRRADALVEICRHYLDTADVPQSGGERPHITLLVTDRALQGDPTVGPCELPGVGVITPDLAGFLACDASIDRITVGGDGSVVDVGRRTRSVPAAMRRALEVRDGGCVIPGCQAPPRWCDAHHIVAWALGGTTALWNLVLLCRLHHRKVHTGEITLPQRE